MKAWPSAVVAQWTRPDMQVCWHYLFIQMRLHRLCWTLNLLGHTIMMGNNTILSTYRWCCCENNACYWLTRRGRKRVNRDVAAAASIVILTIDDPTDQFMNSVPQHPSELHKIPRSTDFKSVKLWNVRSDTTLREELLAENSRLPAKKIWKIAAGLLYSKGNPDPQQHPLFFRSQSHGR